MWYALALGSCASPVVSSHTTMSNSASSEEAHTGHLSKVNCALAFDLLVRCLSSLACEACVKREDGTTTWPTPPVSLELSESLLGPPATGSELSESPSLEDSTYLRNQPAVDQMGGGMCMTVGAPLFLGLLAFGMCTT
jgi:hypothetical protein